MTDEAFNGLGEPLRLPETAPNPGSPDFRLRALEDRVGALANLAATQQRINKRMLAIRTSTGLIAIGGWITAIVALAQR